MTGDETGEEMKMNIHKDKMLWYNTRYCIRVSMREAKIQEKI